MVQPDGGRHRAMGVDWHVGICRNRPVASLACTVVDSLGSALVVVLFTAGDPGALDAPDGLDVHCSGCVDRLVACDASLQGVNDCSRQHQASSPDGRPPIRTELALQPGDEKLDLGRH